MLSPIESYLATQYRQYGRLLFQLAKEIERVVLRKGWLLRQSMSPRTVMLTGRSGEGASGNGPQVRYSALYLEMRDQERQQLTCHANRIRKPTTLIIENQSQFHIMFRLIIVCLCTTTIVSPKSFCTPTKPTSNNPTYLTLQNCQYYYQVTLELGGQNCTFLLDTGSHVMWIATAACRCGSSYNESKSEAYRPTTDSDTLKYGDGSVVTGWYGTESVKATNTTIDETVRMLFVEKRSASGMHSDGLLGMPPDGEMFLEEARRRGEIASADFALRLRDLPEASGMYFDQLPEDMVSQAKYVDISQSHSWTIDCLGFYADSTDLSSSSSPHMIIDSGTTTLVLNHALYQHLTSLYFTDCQKLSDYIICPKDTSTTALPLLTILTRGYKLFIDSKQYVRYSGDEGLIKIMIMQAKSDKMKSETMILGTVLFKAYDVVFDRRKRRVGFRGRTEKMRRIGSDILYYSTIVAVGVMGVAAVGLAGLGVVDWVKKRE